MPNPLQGSENNSDEFNAFLEMANGLSDLDLKHAMTALAMLTLSRLNTTIARLNHAPAKGGSHIVILLASADDRAKVNAAFDAATSDRRDDMESGGLTGGPRGIF